MKHNILCSRAGSAVLALLILSVIWSAGTQIAAAQGTAFTYQGRFNENGLPYTGNAEFQATLWDAASNGTTLASNAPASIIVGVTNGLFVLPLDFGSNFPGADRWLQLEVRTSIGPFTALSPRQALTPTPYAITAGTASNLSGTLPAGQLSGSYSNAVSFNNAGNSFTGSGAGLTSLNASQLTGAVPSAVLDNAWKISGNTGTTPGTYFLGTADNQPLEFKVNGVRALRIEPNTNGAPNVVAGSPRNFVAAGVFGATIAGGGATNFSGFSYTNKVSANFGTVVGGIQNTASGEYSVAMGLGNTASGRASTAMGEFTVASDSYATAMGGGTSASGDYSTAMGVGSTASGSASAAIGSFAIASGDYSTAMGASTAAIGLHSTAMGYRAKANHIGSFVWADSQSADFASTANNQFSIRASNGLRISNPAPGGSLLTLETERPWLFSQAGVGANAALRLSTVDLANPKPFVIVANAVGIGTETPSHLLHVDGVARSAQSTWATSSDQRAKRDIATLEGSLERIAQLRPVSFQYTPEYAAGRKGYEGRFTGFIAQEVEPLFPEMVETVHEKIGDREVEDFRVLNAGGLTPHLVSAVQGLNQKLQQKETEITDLKQRLEALEKIIRDRKSN